jgi:peptide/nickel transport system substrate-binding protein
MMRTFLIAGLLATAAAIPAADAQKAKDTLRIGFYQPVRLVDYFFEPGPEATLAARMVFDTLVNYDPDKREFTSGIAKSWKRIDDRTMEFEIRDDIKFHDGEPLDVDDVLYSFKFMVDPKVNYRFKESRISWIDSFEKVGKSAFRVRSKEPMAILVARMNNFPPIYPQHIHAKLEQKNSFGLHAVGSGPMRVVEFDSSTGMTLVKNPSYKGNSGKPAVQVGRARIDAVPDHQTQVARMIRGEQDLMYNVDKDQAESFAGNPDFKVDVQDAVSFNYVMFDAKARSGAKMFADKNVRLALEYAINRKALRQLLHKAVANAEPLDAVCHPKILHCAWSKKPPEFDPAKAKKLLADAGYPNGFDVEILTWGEARDTAEAVAGMWREVGVNASVNVQTFGAFVKTRSAGVPAIVTLWDNSVGQPDIDNTAEYFFLPNARNYNKDPELEKLALAGRRELDPKKRTEIYRRMFDGATEEAYLMPLQRIPAVIVHRKEVRLLGGTTHPKGFEINHVAWN